MYGKEFSLQVLIPHLSSLQVLVFPLSDSGFLFLLPSVQMTPPTGEIRHDNYCKMMHDEDAVQQQF